MPACGVAAAPAADNPPNPPPGNGLPLTVPRKPARRAAEDELSDPAYHQDDPGVLERLLGWVWERLAELLSSAADASPGGAVGLVTVAVLVAVLLLALWLRLGPPRATNRGGPDELFEEGPRDAADHRARADAHAAAGRWDEAVKERVRALVRSLEERTLLHPRPGRTADEAATEAAVALPGHTSDLKRAARDFDEVAYGGRPADAAMYERLRVLDNGLRRTTPHLAEADATRGGIVR